MKNGIDKIIQNEIELNNLKIALKGIHKICEAVLYGNDTKSNNRTFESNRRILGNNGRERETQNNVK
jgi:hypothetical protein